VLGTGLWPPERRCRILGTSDSLFGGMANLKMATKKEAYEVAVNGKATCTSFLGAERHCLFPSLENF